MKAIFHIVIPARFASSRLPGKPLTPLAGRPLVEHVWRRAGEGGAKTVVVATDDERVTSCVEDFGGRACLTRADHASGSDRVAEVAEQLGFGPDEVVVNLQGDAPLVDRAHIRAVAGRALRDDLATLASPLSDPAEATDPNVVKVVLDAAGRALYFSRAPIPASHPARATRPRYLRHTGLYAYRVRVLKRLTAEPPCEPERCEGLEQLRALWLGMSIGVEVVDPPPGPEVDTPEDVRRVESLLRSV
ncbi:MAG: 3-deoxy-manno-octulosonate cytidylyltransferase [Gammaproteobacteria bacterium]|nr:3-deoxy-manno-octulosonate cytidylyltransferase [Gammaproteobacteria bacterium]MDE0414080.1 3-deoxy-manno-octulosonate cytidylyltransferase [Gammaproteobacteria bacterium]